MEINALIRDVFRHEGGYVEHPLDRGGPTKYGITQSTLSHFYERAVTKEEVKELDVDTATKIYKRNYYYGPGIDELPTQIQPFVFDSAVNHGPRRAIKFVQIVINRTGIARLLVDGVMGRKTQTAAYLTQQRMGKIFVEALFEERRLFFVNIVE